MTPERPKEREVLDVRVKKEVEFPTDPEKRFEAVFSAIGNSEAKCLTLLCLSQSPLAAWDLHWKFVAKSGGVWKSNQSNQANYCLRTLIPIGLVAEADTLYFGSTEYVTGFRLTEAGLRYGQPLASFLLEKSSTLPYSLLKVFGKTESPGTTRSIINRVKIMETLYFANTPQRRIDIARQLNLVENVVGGNLKYLSELGLVEYYSCNVEEKGYVKYVLSKDINRKKIKNVGGFSKLTYEVADLLFELGTVDAQLLAEKLRNRYPKYQIDSLRGTITEVLSGLSTQGICEREKFFGGKIQSQASINQAGENLVHEILLPIRQALSGDENLLFKWRRIFWQNYAKEAILKYKETSGKANQRSLENWVEETQLIISQNPGIRHKDIRSLLSRVPTDILKILLYEGRVKKERQGRAVRYYLV